MQFSVDEAIYARNPEGWTCYIEERDPRCLRVINDCAISLPKRDVKRKYEICALDLGVRVAVPRNYVVVLAKLTDPDPTSRGVPVIRVANGLIDSGYRGNVRVVLLYEAACTIPKNGLVIRLALVQLAYPDFNSRVLFDLADITPHLDCGPNFSMSIATAAKSHSAQARPLLPPGGEKLWPGTGCRALVCLYSDRVSRATHYNTLDSNVIFAVRYNDSTTVIGLKDVPKYVHKTFVRFYTSGQFATFVPFYETFNTKRHEDAAYDIFAPSDIVLESMSSVTIAIQQRYACADKSMVPWIFGRSSMNLRGLIISPSRWMPDSWLTLTLCNLTEAKATIKRGDRIAQLLLVNQEAAALLPTEGGTAALFPTVGKCRRPAASAEAKWRETAAFDTESGRSERECAGFGSSGQ